MIEYNNSKLLGNLNMKKGIEIEEVKWIEIKLQKLTVLKKELIKLKSNYFRGIFVSHFKTWKILCLTKSWNVDKFITLIVYVIMHY